jgi:peroxiredoxin
MDVALVAARLVLAAVFVVAGTAKLADRAGSRQAVLDFGAPSRLAGVLGVGLPVVELAVAVALIPTATAWWGALGALGLLLLFIVVIGTNIARGRRPDCRCLGQLSAGPIGWSTLARTVVLAAIAGFVAVGGSRDAGPSPLAWLADRSAVELAGLAGLVLVVGLLGTVALLLVNLVRQNGRLFLRIEALEARLEAAGIAPAPEQILSESEAGLPVGAPAPAFQLSGLHGETLTLDALRAAGKPILLIFTDPDCTPCTTLLPEIGMWQRDYSPVLMISVVSRGAVDANRAKSTEHGLFNVLLQQEREVAEAYGAEGTPSAVIVSPDGTIGSSVVAGPDGIRALVARQVGTPFPSSSPPAASALPAAAGNGSGDAAAVAPSPALKIGMRAPRLKLSDLRGRTVNLAGMRGSKTLVLFWDPACGFCSQMLDELKAWEADPPEGAPKLLVVSTGTVEENREMGLRAPVVLDSGFKSGHAFGAAGTPSAVLVDEKGRIASEMAVGAEQVLSLAGAQHGSSPDVGAPEPRRIGESAPAFELPDLGGDPVRLVDFRGSATLVVFWNPGCGFCQRMLDDLKAWEADPPEAAPKLLVVSTGSAEANEALGLRSPVLLDQDFSVAPTFGANGTPMAVLVDEEGRIASEVAAGAPAVMAIARGAVPAPPAG